MYQKAVRASLAARCRDQIKDLVVKRLNLDRDHVEYNLIRTLHLADLGQIPHNQSCDLEEDIQNQLEDIQLSLLDEIKQTSLWQ